MHRSRINGLLIDCKTDDIDAAAQFWADTLGRPIDMKHPGSRGGYRMLETPPDELSVQIQRVDHESRVHIDIETDDIPAEVARLEKLGAKVDERKERWVIMRAPTGQRFCIVRVQRANWPKNANQWEDHDQEHRISMGTGRIGLCRRLRGCADGSANRS